jgi:hypothetical protein
MNYKKENYACSYTEIAERLNFAPADLFGQAAGVIRTVLK